MNIRDALAAIFVLELLVLLALGHYSHQLHQLQSKRELLTFKSSTAPAISSKVGSSSSPSVSAGNRSESELPTKLGSDAVEEAKRKQQELEEGIRKLGEKIQQQQKLLQQQQRESDARQHMQARAAASADSSSSSADEDDDDEDDDDTEEEGRSIGDQPGSVAKASSAASSSALKEQPAAAETDGREGGVEEAAAAAASLQPPLQQAESSALPSAAAAVSKAAREPEAGGRSGVTGVQVRVQGEGDYEVLWHDGALHVRKFALKDSAVSFYDTLPSNVAHRLSNTKTGVELSRLVWQDAPWPPQWLPDSPSSPPSSSSSPPSSSSSSSSSSSGSLSSLSPPSVSSGSAAASSSSASATSPDAPGEGAGRASVGAAAVGAAAAGAVGASVDMLNGGAWLRVQDGAKMRQEGRLYRGGGREGGAGGSGGGSRGGGDVGRERVERQHEQVERQDAPDAATVGRIHRAPQGQYVKRTESRYGPEASRPQDVSISTHLSCDRIERLEAYFRRWPGPIVAALYLKDPTKDEAHVDRLERLLKAARRGNYKFILVYPTDPTLYPANVLRNIALEPVETEFVFLLDIDLVPDVGFYPYVMSQYTKLAQLADTHVFTIPAFQGIGSVATVEADFPVDHEDLVKMVAAKQVKPILSGEKEFWEAFKCLNYDKWYDAKELYLADYRWPCEPYLLGKTKSIPRYDERFVHYGNDKAQHVLNIFYKQYRFGVLPDHFLLHWTHALAEWADDKKRNAHMGEIMELTETFKFESGTEAGVNWHTGVKFAPGTYRVKNGVKIVWNGNEWIDEATGKATDPL